MKITRGLLNFLSYFLLQMFAEASLKHSEAAMIAAENDRVRNALDERRLILEEKRLQVDENLIKNLNNMYGLLDKILDKYV